MGTCFVRHSDKLVYVNIPKNATEYCKLIFDGMPTNFYENQIPIDYTYLIVLRDPLERWYSGLAEYIQRYTSIDSTSEIFDQVDVLKLLTTATAHDEHTELQLRFISEAPCKNAVFFNFNNNLTTNITSWFQENNLSYIHALSNKKRNITEKPWVELRTRLKEHIESDSKLLQAVNDYLVLDRKLYNSVQYYIKGDT